MSAVVRILALGLLLLAGATLPAAAQDVGTASRTLAGNVGNLAELKNRKMAIVDFATGGGRMTELGSFLADQLGVALTSRARGAGFRIVTRRELCQAIRENKLWVDDRFDPELHRKLGRWAEADFILAGRITALERQVALSVRVINTVTLDEIWAESLTLSLDEGLRALLAQPVTGDGCGGAIAQLVSGGPTAPVETARPPGPPATPPLQVKVWTDKSSYRVGEPVRVGLRVNRDAYVTLVNIGTSGDVMLIYPNRFDQNSLVRAGQDVLIPPPDARFTFEAGDPPGFDQIRAIATEQPVQLVAPEAARGASVFPPLDQRQTRDLAAAIAAARRKIAPTKWAEDVVAVEVVR